MTDVIFYDISHEERGEIDTHHGEDELEPVGSCLVKRACEQCHYLVD